MRLKSHYANIGFVQSLQATQHKMRKETLHMTMLEHQISFWLMLIHFLKLPQKYCEILKRQGM